MAHSDPHTYGSYQAHRWCQKPHLSLMRLMTIDDLPGHHLHCECVVGRAVHISDKNCSKPTCNDLLMGRRWSSITFAVVVIEATTDPSGDDKDDKNNCEGKETVDLHLFPKQGVFKLRRSLFEMDRVLLQEVRFIHLLRVRGWCPRVRICSAVGVGIKTLPACRSSPLDP